MSAWGPARVGDLAVGGILAALGLFIGVETILTIPAGPSYAAVGPRAFPGLIGAGLVGIGALLASRAVRQAGTAEDDSRYDWSAVLWIVATLASQIVLLAWVGWVPAATLVFVGVARAFGSRKWWRDALLGASLAALTFVLFNFVLGLELPAGQLIEAVRGR